MVNREALIVKRGESERHKVESLKSLTFRLDDPTTYDFPTVNE